MKKYYAVILLVLFLIYNLFKSFVIEGLLYQIFMIGLIITNLVIILKYKDEISYKKTIGVIYFLAWFFSKNIFQCYFAFSNVIIICVIESLRNKKSNVPLIVMEVLLFLVPAIIVSHLFIGTKYNKDFMRNDISKDYYYLCEDNISSYRYSGSAKDSYHYSIGKYYEIARIDNLIYIAYDERNEVSQKEYKKYIAEHECNNN